MKVSFPGSTGPRTPLCPSESCEQVHSARVSGPRSKRVVRKGFFYRKSDGRRITRFHCRNCRRSFSLARFSSCYRQKKRKHNEPVRKLLCSGVSQRRIAKLLHLNRKTVVRKFLFLAAQARLRHESFLLSIRTEGKLPERLQFDEMESSERSKCLPLSIPLLVDSKTRRILGHRVCEMPAKGHLAEISIKKYGFRNDDRNEAARLLLESLQPFIHSKAQILTDENPRYPNWLKNAFPESTHRTVLGKRGAVTGQGELKKIGFDPLFSLNHTCAMLRANINRLFRRTWCTTKRSDRLDAHIALYVDYHNRELVRS